MEGYRCPYCGETYYADSKGLNFKACCELMDDELNREAEEEADRRLEIRWERMNNYEGMS